MASRPRSSLAASSGLPIPGAGVTTRRKSGLPSPGTSPSKSSKGAASSDEIANRMSELQAAIRSKDPASYGASGRRSALGASTTTMDEDEVEMLQPLSAQSPPEFASPRPVRRIPSSASALRPTPQSTLRSLNENGRDGERGTPTSTPGPAASFVRPGSSLSSSSYMSAHAASDNRARSPMPHDVPVTPAKRTSDTLAPNSSRLTRTASNVSSASSFRTAPSSAYRGDDGSNDAPPQVGDRVQAAGMEGILRYVGEVHGKPGTWAGVELVGDYVGKGKNDGNVQGRQYFACPPECGIFALLSKVQAMVPHSMLLPSSPPASSTRRTFSRPSSSLSTAGSSAGPTPRRPLPRPSGSLVPPSTVARQATKTSSDASQYASSQITAGSRASSYLNLTAKQLQERKAQSTTNTAASPSTLRSPRKSSTLLNSTASAYSTGGPTPKATRTTGRPSGVIPSARKSIGNTPGASSSIRRPGSSMRSHTPDVPSVPPLPTAMSASNNVASTPARRYSSISRPTTPSGRPSSRQSNAASVSRSVSRASSRASLLSGPSRLGHREDDDAEETLKDADQASLQELQTARDSLNKATREAEQAKLELLELTSDFRDEQKKTKALQLEVDELKRKAADSRLDQASAIDERQAEKEQQSAELERLNRELEDARKQVEETKNAQATMTSELEQGHDLLARLQAERDASAKEAKSFAEQLDELQKAGRAMVDLYEDKFQNLEEEFQTTQDALQAREKQLRDMQEEIERQQALLAKRDQANRDANTADAFLAASLGAGRPMEQQESALAIENDDLRAELAHVKKRMTSLEEELYDKTVEFESRLEKEKLKRQESGEVIDKYKNEVKDFKEQIDKIKNEKVKAEERAHELETALRESQQTLETERVELENLRNEQQQQNTSSSGRNDELAHLRSALTVAQHEKKDKEKEIRKLKSDLESIQEELKLMEEIREEGKVDGTDGEDTTEITKFIAEIREKDEKIMRLQHELAQHTKRGLPTISTEPTDTDSIPTPIQSTFNQHLSPHDHPSSPKESPSSSTSSPLRRKRDSNTSIHSNTSLSSLTSLGSNHRRGSLKDESSMLKDEIEGFKILLRQAEAENMKLKEKSEIVEEEASRLKDGQKALESTVNNLVEQLEAQQAGKGSHTPVTMPVLPPKTSSQELLEAEVKELKGTLARLEKEYRKDKENLNSEVLQLELLVEAKIFREGELESQLEDVRRALAASKSSVAAITKLANGDLPPLKNHDSPRRGKSTVKADRSSVSSIISHSSSVNNKDKDEGENVPAGRRSASQYSEEDYDDGLCEICKEDHAVENCPIFGGSAASDTENNKNKNKAHPNGENDAPYCDDCEEYGHDLANCPLADEVF